MSLLKKISKRLFDLFFIVEEESATAEVVKEPPRPEPTPVKAEPLPAEPLAEAKPAEEPDTARTDTDHKQKPEEDRPIVDLLLDATFGGAITTGDIQPEKRRLTAQDKKREEVEYLGFKKEVLGRAPKSAAAAIKAFADIHHRELTSLERDGERVKKYGLSKAVICKSRGRYRARYEKVRTYEMRSTDNLETMHIVDGEGRCYNNLGRAFATIKNLAHKAELLKTFIGESYGAKDNNRELVAAVMDAKNELAKEKHIKTGGK